MTPEEEKTITMLQTNVRRLIYKFQTLRKEYDEMEARAVRREEEVLDLRAKNEALTAQYNNLKMAKMLEIGDTDLQSAKQRMARLVREVDKCIVTLKSMEP